MVQSGKKDLLSVTNLTRDEFIEILKLAGRLKEENLSRVNRPYLSGKNLGMLFAKPSTRTRVSFEVAMNQLGGHAIYMQYSDLQLARGETLADTARVLSRYLDGLVARVHRHEELKELSLNSKIPIINALSDLEHPCQAISDFFTISERKKLNHIKLAFIGDANNVANSLMLASALMGTEFTIASPKGFEPIPEILKMAIEIARKTGSKIIVTNDPVEAAKGADVIYTDVWVSMGQELEAEKRRKSLRLFQVDLKLMAVAKEDAIFMHCLPAHRGEEVTQDVIDGPRSIVFDQAENRLHAQKAILISLLS